MWNAIQRELEIEITCDKLLLNKGDYWVVYQ